MPPRKRNTPASPEPAAPPENQAPRAPSFAILYLEQALDRIFARIPQAASADELMRLARALSLCTTALFNAHRIDAMLRGGLNPMDEALKALGELDFDED